MFKVLLKKQLMDVFRSWFYNPKTNQLRTAGGTIAFILIFLLVTVGVFGGFSVVAAIPMCGAFCTTGFDWMYYSIFGLIAIALGLFGSVFSTYSALYLSKDNDLLLSMPIPVRLIIASRIFITYLMGLLYAGLFFVPAIIVNQALLGFNPLALVGGIVMLFEISLIVLFLSSLLGWVVAKLSIKLKRKSFITVIISLAFFALYYYVFFNAQKMIQSLITNVRDIGDDISGFLILMHYWGQNGTAVLTPTLVSLIVCLALALATWYFLSKSFIKIATATPKEKRANSKNTTEKALGLEQALLKKEFARFTSSANYMLNCGLGIVLIPALGILMLVKSNTIVDFISSGLGPLATAAPVVIVAAACLISSMNIMAAPSISLEGKSLWVVQSLPITPWSIIKSKLSLQLICSIIPMVIFCICLSIILSRIVLFTAVDIILSDIMIMAYTILSSLFAMFMGLKMPNLTWSNEIIPIKQSGSVMISIFGGWAFAAVMALLFIVIVLFNENVSLSIYLGVFIIISAVLSLLTYRWLRTKGSRILQFLH